MIKKYLNDNRNDIWVWGDLKHTHTKQENHASVQK